MNKKPNAADTVDRLAKLSPVKQALFELQELRTKLKEIEQDRTEPVAIIGMGCRFPGGANNPETFWQLLSNGVDAITEVPPDRWDVDSFYDPDPLAPGKASTRWGGFLTDIDQFDPQFFGISPREAVDMDPQHRLLLEVSWEALEHAGQAPDKIGGSRTAVFVGMSTFDYTQFLFDEGQANFDAYLALGINHSAASGRLSYLLGLQGPTMSIDTACSSSLVAVHLGVQSLRNKECQMALVGGVNIILIPELFIGLSKLHMMAADGRCKTFDARADGFVRAEGCGMLVLKHLSDALANRDNILAVIRGSAVNQDGRSNGFTAPNELAQEAVIREALANGEVKPEQVGFVEAHGTGTSLGDPIEVLALGRALCQRRSEKNRLLVGSVKTNLGHLEAAAGVASLMKVVLALQHKEIPPHLHLHEPNPYIPWAELPIDVPTQRTPFQASNGHYIAGVSSFGFSGTNAHVVVEAAPELENEPAEIERPLHLLTLSANNEVALRELSHQYKSHLAPEQMPFTDICFTANAGRAHLSHRLAVVAGSEAQAREKLAVFAAGQVMPGMVSNEIQSPKLPEMVFLFTGQGAQYVGMGRQLYQTQPTFRQALDQCDELLRPYLGRPLLSVLYPEDEATAGLLDETAYTQPALFVLEYALAQLWRSWGLEPAVVMGHSVGEYVAACVAGVFSLADGLKLIAERGRLMQTLPKNGVMAAVFAPEERVEAALASYTEWVSIAAINGPQNIVISGEAKAVQAVLTELEAEGIRTQRLNVSHAFHSPLMEPILAEFEQVAVQVAYQASRIPLISNLTGRMLESDEVPAAAYWRRHIREPVRFASAIENLHEQGDPLFVEVGPSPILLGMARRCVPEDGAGVWLPSLRQGRDDWQQMLESLGTLYTRGAAVDWAGFDRDYPRRRLTIPTYPFQRQRYWVQSGPRRAAARIPDDGLRKDWLYELSWQPKERATGHQYWPGRPGAWLIFADQEGIGKRLAERLRERGETCVLVRLGQTYAAIAAEQWEINPTQLGDFERLLTEALPPDGQTWRGIVHLWSTDIGPLEETDPDALQEGQLLNSGSVLHLIQVLAKTDQTGPSRLWLVTRGAQPVEQTDMLTPAQAPLWGLGQTLTLEHPDLGCVCVDLAPSSAVEAGYLLAEEVWSPDGEDRIAFREESRYVARLIPSTTVTVETGPQQFQAAATYLITGGFGSLGLMVARWMVDQGVRHLVLIGRRGAASEAARQAVLELEQAGVQVIEARGDVTNRADLSRILSQIEQPTTEGGFGLPPLRGIIHAAGVVTEGRRLQQDDWAHFIQVMAAKVDGAWHLHSLTQTLSLDFFVLFSSAASILGLTGQASYAAANAFLDVLAHHRRLQGRPALSINWGAWAEVGMMAGRDRRQQQLWLKLGMGTIAPEQGLQILAQVLLSPSAQVGVLPVDWPIYLRSFSGVEPPSLFAEIIGQIQSKEQVQPASESEPRLLQELSQVPPSQYQDILVAHIGDQARVVLGLDPAYPINLHQPLSELGLDSLMAVELRNLLSNSVGQVLPVPLLFNYPTLEALTEYLVQEVLALEAAALSDGQHKQAAVIAMSETDPIAIIGMGLRFPGGVRDPETFWQLLRDGVDAIVEIPASRWDVDAYYDPDPTASGKMYTRGGGFLVEIDQFDPHFFGIAPREAISMDPQQRLLLEVSWEALENAGQAPDKFKGSQTGVFIGISNSDYFRLLASNTNNIDGYLATGSTLSVAAGRLSYILGLQGPNMAVDTACSSSLVAVHLACQSLRSGESNLALAGGVNLILSPEANITLSKSQAVAADDRCKTFDAAADGYVRGEGCAVVVLKRLSDALTEGDNILALIRGSAINQDGRSNGLTAPNGPSQEAVIRRALANARVKPSQVSYVEAHGTGTPLGDPIEIEALAAVFGENRAEDTPLAIGSVKTNIGHLESAAGVASLIKVILSLQHREIPPHLHFHTPNPYIPWENIPISVPTEPTPWSGIDNHYIAGVSSFGFSGTNAHVLVEAAPESEATVASVERPLHLLTLSTRHEVALTELINQFERYLALEKEAFADICFTANVGRAHLSHRLAVVAESATQARDQLAALVVGDILPGVMAGEAQSSEQPKIAFLFTGQGSQYGTMGRQLYDTQPSFRQVLNRCDEVLRAYLDRPLLSVLYPQSEEDAALLHETAYTQPALFALEYALTELWRSWGITPAVVAGHSVGEYVAACVAGVFNLEDGLKLIAKRGQLMQSSSPKGAMAVVFADLARVATALMPYTGQVSIAAVNGPTNVVISGESHAVDTIIEDLQAEKVKVRRLTVSHAFHSPLVEPILDAFEQAAHQVQFHPPRLPLLSNVTGQLFNPTEIPEADYWRRHLREGVKFAAGMATLHAKGYSVFVEIGPSPTLLGMGRRCLPEESGGVWLPSLRQGRADWQQMLESLGKLYVGGVQVDWAGFEGDYPRRRVPLPTYPFQRQRYWLKSTLRQQVGRPPDTILHPLLGQRLRSAGREIVFETQLNAEQPSFLADHRVHGAVVLPATAYLEMALAAAQVGLGAGAPVVEDVVMHRALVLDNETQTVQIVLTPDQKGVASFQIASLEEGTETQTTETWNLHATGKVRAVASEGDVPTLFAPEELQQRCPETVPARTHYQRLLDRGLEFGLSFQGVVQIWQNFEDGEALGQIGLPETLLAETAGYRLHPALLDACLQPIGVIVPISDNSTDPYLPMSLDSFRLYGSASAQLWSHVSIRSSNGSSPDMVKGDVLLLDGEGHLVAEVRGLTLRRAGQEAVRPPTPTLDDWLYEVVWRPHPISSSAGTKLLSPAQIAERLQPHLSRLSTEPDSVSFQELIPQLNTLSTAYILKALQQLGFDFSQGERFSLVSLARQLGVVALHQRLLGRLLEILQEDGLMKRVGDEWEMGRAPKVVDPEAQLASLLADYPACQVELAMIGHLGRHFAEALRGERDPLELLFPASSLEEVEKLYRDSSSTRGFNILVRETVSAVLEQLPMNRTIHILEIGAGTGGTTTHILPSLRSDRIEYVFSDVSPLFTNKARQKFQDHPFMRYQVLDIERDPAAQDFTLHQFDLVLAANVLHATRDLRQTLKNVQKLLASEGMVILLEGTGQQPFADIFVGLTEGWWRFEDADLRPSYPLLTRARWLELLTEMDFAEATALSGETALSHQAVLLARGPRLEQDENTPQTLATAGKWLIFADQGGLGEQMAERLQTERHEVVLIWSGEKFEQMEAAQFRVDPTQPEHFQRLLDQALDRNGSFCQGIVHLWALDELGPAMTESTTAELSQVQEELCGSVLHLTQALVKVGGLELPGLWLVTRGVQPVGEPYPPPAVGPATLWGLGRVIAQEHPELNCVRIDLDPSGSADELESLLRTIVGHDAEDQIAIRHQERFVPRLVPSSTVTHSTNDWPKVLGGHPFSLDISARGVLDNLEFRPLTRRPPASGEVEVEIEATGLGFRDVLSALGMIAQETGPLGAECAGRIAAIGAKVDDFKIGDEVIAMALGSFSSYVTIPVDFVVHKPRRLSLTEAATIPSAFLTAYYTLHRLASMSASDRVLIHAAAGGVGLAAVQLAQRAGAEIFATAGTPAKRALLRSLGVQHVMDSRSLGFAEEIMTVTRGEGVDIILNSLADDFIAKSLSVLADDGRFLEIGKRGVWDQAQVAQLKPNATYVVADLLTLAEQDPALIATMVGELVAAFNEGSLKPLPLRTFSIQNVVEAFRYMAQAKHVGKIVVTQRETSPMDPLAVHSTATYLITGGLGGLGLVFARWLVEQGGRHLVLVGRSAPSDAARTILDELEQIGAQVVVAQVDVSKADDIGRVLAEIDQSMPPLQGIIHAAGVLDDGVLVQQNWARFAKVFAPKVYGAWNLHALTRNRPLDFFVLFSSAVSLLGAAGQANHVAESTFLDGLAYYRRTQGLPGLSIDWGPWSDVGAAAEHRVEKWIGMRGLDSIRPRQGLQLFERVMQQVKARPSGSGLIQVGVLPLDWPKFLQQFVDNDVPPFFAEMARDVRLRPDQLTAKTKAADEPSELLHRLEETPPGGRRDLLLDYIRTQSLKVLGLESTYQLDRRQPLQELGLDSLMAIELRNLLGTGLKLKGALPATLVFKYPTVETLTGFLAEQLFPSMLDRTDSQPDTQSIDQVTVDERALTELKDISDEEAAELLLAELDMIDEDD